MLSILFSMPIAFSEELYFDADFDFYGDDRFQKDRRYLLGDTVTIIGHSSYYDESTDVDFSATDSTFHVIIKNPTQKIILDENYVSDDEGNIELSFILSDEYEIGEYKVEMIVNKQKHLNLPFFVGPTTEKIISADSTFDLWLEDSNPVVFSYVDLLGVMCSDAMIQFEKDSEFVFPFDGYIVKSSDVRFIANFTLPNGNHIQSSGEFNKNSCVPFSVGVPKTDFSGKWSVYVTAWWLNDDVLYTTQSDEISFSVKDPIFYDTFVEEIKLDFLSASPTLLDFHEDRSKVLLKQIRTDDLAILDLNDNSITKTNLVLPVEKMELRSAKFSNQDYLFVHNNQELWKFFPESKEAEKFLSGVEFFDVLENGSVVYSILNDQDLFDLYMINDDGSDKQLLVHNEDIREFDVTQDGAKLVHRKTLDAGYGWRESVLEIFDLQTGQKHDVPNVKLTCGSVPVWAPNNELILHMTSGCGRGWMGGVLYITTSDGSYTETVVPSSNYLPHFLSSPDGSFLLTTSFGEDYHDPDSLYKVTLAKPIPEFQTVAVIILAGSLLSVTLLSNKLFQHRFRC
jgi:predicted secreted protein with PEFG-CTERM motif